jgi:CDP-paratose 2-epimerase
MRVLITGGAGFVGSNLALAFRDRGAAVTALDNLHRRGSELNLPRFRERGIEFVHGDIRQPGDLEALDGRFDVFVEAAAEPSVHAGPEAVLSTNLTGTLHCLEFARKRAGVFVFLSTSRVYSIEPLRALPLEETETRFTGPAIDEAFPTHQPRSFYGASKLASELIIQEYVASFGMRAVIDRCGVIAGAGQFGKVDQGVFTYWMAAHHFGLPLTYTGFRGKQVRDLLHPTDLFALIEKQVDRPDGQTYNVGGGAPGSVSLRELTALCREITGNAIEVAEDAATSPVDVPHYVTDHARVSAAFDWEPHCTPREIMNDIHTWIRENEDDLRPIFTGGRR